MALIWRNCKLVNFQTKFFFLCYAQFTSFLGKFCSIKKISRGNFEIFSRSGTRVFNVFLEVDDYLQASTGYNKSVKNVRKGGSIK